MTVTRNSRGARVPSELEGAAKIEDVNALELKVGNCYSSERYETFQGAVEKIISRYLRANVAWAILLWLLTIIGSFLLQKFFKII